ncbi:MAG: hypothetical protein P1V20_11700 [Verrucomicrobiales bacterium]|nr:hypothetical protein [Verrucomicrobiales bacterium]
MKTNNTGVLPLIGIRIFFAALISAVAVPEFAAAQQRTSGVEVQFGSVYQGGRKSKRGIVFTTSGVNLPNLNAILSPAPLPKDPPQQNQSTAATQQAQAANGTTTSPRFGYGSGPVQPPLVDPTVPVDPGYDDTQPVPQAQPAPVQPGIQFQQSTTIPFAHSYYPRTYVPSIPYIYSPFSGGHCYHHHRHSCGTYSSFSSRLRSLTSSRSCLSGFGIPRVSFRFSF